MFLTNEQNVIVEVSEEIISTQNGFKSNGSLFIEPGLTLFNIDLPQGIKTQTHIYENGQFKINPNYTEPTKTPEELQNEVDALNKALLDLTEIVLMGGV
jgi:hypothetical protein